MKSTTFRALCAASLTLMLAAGCGTLAERGDMQAAKSWQAVSFSKAGESKGVVLYYGDRDKLTKLVEAGADVWAVDTKNKRAQAGLTQETARLAQSLGMRVEVKQVAANRGFDKQYRTYDQILARLRELDAKADFAELVDIGDSWEKTQGKANRDLWALKITKGGKKPVVTMAACHHAREIVTPEMVLMQAEHLVENYGRDAAVTAAVENTEIYLIPMVNPDGHHVVATTGQDQRKNTNNVTGGKRRLGVDLNRNYDIAWGTVGDSGQPESDTFRGTKAFSEPETAAMRDFLSAHPPVIYLTFHSYANTVMWPWDHKKEKPVDPRLSALGTQLGKLSGYSAYQGCEMYLNSGDDVDWAHAKLGSLAYTIEIGGWGDGFMPSYSKVPKFWSENAPMMAYALKVAGNPAAVFGPAVKAEAKRGALSIQAPGAKRVELFRGRPGAAGTGEALALKGSQAIAPVRSGARELLYVHAQGANGQWGPFEAVWSN